MMVRPLDGQQMGKGQILEFPCLHPIDFFLPDGFYVLLMNAKHIDSELPSGDDLTVFAQQS